MKYVFFGTPEFAVIILEKLIQAGLMPEAVICNFDKPVGRKQIVTPPPVKASIKHQASRIKDKIKIFQPQDKTELLEIIKNLQPDLAIVAAFGMIFPKKILIIPKYGFINVHPSLLPKYRGPTPIQTAILNGDKETGVGLFLVDEEIDKGKIIANSKLQIVNSDNYETLSKKLAELGADLLIKTLPDFVAGKITPLPQNESRATYTKKFSTQDAYIEPKDLETAQNQRGEIAIEISRKIRALNPEPGVWTIKDGKRMKILEAEIVDGRLKLKKIQIEGKNPILYN